MKGLLSLEQELRAARMANGKKNSKRPDHTPDTKETERPWQADIDLMQQTMREVLRAVASLSGVELPGLPSGIQDDAAPPPRLDIKTLKDRFRTELEGFSIKTTEELAKRAREQTQAAMEAIQNEAGGRIDQVAAQLREKLELPAQIEKLLDPCVKEAAARLETSVCSKVEHQLAGQEQFVQQKLQGAIGSVQAQISSLERTMQQIREKADTATTISAEPPYAKVEERLAEQERLVQQKLQGAIGSVQTQISALERTMQQMREKADSATRMPAESPYEKVEERLAEQERLVQQKLQGAIGSVQAQISALERTMQQVREKADSATRMPAEPPYAKVEERLAEQERLVQQKLQGALNSVQAQISSLERTMQQVREKADSATRMPAEPPYAKVEERLAEQERLVQQKLQGAIGSVQTQISSLERTMQQMREKADSVEQMLAEQSYAATDNAKENYEDTTGSESGGTFDQAMSRIKWSISKFREIPRVQPAQSTVAPIEWLRKAIPSGNMDMLVRVQEAMDNLDRLGSKSQHPARS